MMEKISLPLAIADATCESGLAITSAAEHGLR